LPFQQPVEGRLRPHARSQKAEPARPERRVGERLGGHGADGATRPRHDGADRHELGLRGHPHLTARGIGGHNRERHVYLTRGSRNAYSTSTTRFATTMNSAARTVTPITAGKSFVVRAWMPSCPTPWRFHRSSTMMAPPNRYPRSIPKSVTIGVMATRTP